MTAVGDQKTETLEQCGETLQENVTQGEIVGVKVLNIEVSRIPFMVSLKKMGHSMVIIILT